MEEYANLGLCAPGDAIRSASNRCNFFSSCRECLYEYVSHNEEYDRIDYKIVNNEGKEKF